MGLAALVTGTYRRPVADRVWRPPAPRLLKQQLCALPGLARLARAYRRAPTDPVAGGAASPPASAGPTPSGALPLAALEV